MKRGPKPFTKEYLIKKLQEAFTILGYSPSQTDLEKLPNFPSRGAFRNRFGTLEQAKVLAKIPPSPKGMNHPNRHAAHMKIWSERPKKQSPERPPRRRLVKKQTLKLRFQVLHRDNFTCQYCGRTPKDGIKLEVDHITPRKNGGESVFETS